MIVISAITVMIKNTTKLFNILKDISDRKNLCNVTIHCADGIVHNNKLMVGLVFPVLDMVEEFNMHTDIVLVMPGETVLEIKNKFEQLLEICKEVIVKLRMKTAVSKIIMI